MLTLTRADWVARFDGRRWRSLANVRRLGFGGYVTVEPLAGGLIGLLASRQVAVLRSDGSVFAAARFPPRRGRFSVAGNSGLVADSSGRAVAFTVTSGNTGYGNVGRESLYLLRSGERSAREIYHGRLRFAICERWASLSWHGDWLLYATTEGKTLAIDSRRPARRVDLSALVRRLASWDGEGKIEAQVEWAS